MPEFVSQPVVFCFGPSVFTVRDEMGLVDPA